MVMYFVTHQGFFPISCDDERDSIWWTRGFKGTEVKKKWVKSDMHGLSPRDSRQTIYYQPQGRTDSGENETHLKMAPTW